MKRRLLFFIVLFLLFSGLSWRCVALNTDSYDDVSAQLSNDFFSDIDEDIKRALEEFGISDFDYTQIYNISFENFLQYFKTTLPEKFNICLSHFLSLSGVVLIVSLVSSFFSNTQQGDFFKIFSVVCVTVTTVSKINVCVNSLITAIRLGGNFMLSFVPVLVFIVSVSGNPTSAITYNTFIMAFTQGISVFINYFAVDIIGCFFCLCVCVNMNDLFNVNRLLNAVNRATSFILGITASVFTGFLSLKSVMSVSLDSVAGKGIRFAISSLVPVLGSSISEAYSSVLGSINLIKSSVAVVGIIAVLIINIPVLTEVLLNYFSLSFLSYLSESTGCNSMANTFRSFACAMRILMLLCVFQMFVLIISTGIMLVIKGGM